MKKSFVYAALSLLLFSCGRFGNQQADDTKDIRIVCLSKHLTEFMFELGKGHDLVGVDLSSTYPDSAKFIKTVGYHRALNPEGIIALVPDLVIHSNDIGPANVLPQIIKAGLNVKAFGSANTIDSAKITIRELGKYFGEEKKADYLCKTMDADLARATDSLKAMNIKDTPTVMIIHFGRANNIYFVMSGRKTGNGDANGVGDKMIALAGGKTAAFNAEKGARQLSAEAVAASNPDMIIATDYGYDQMGSMDKFISDIPGVALTNAGKNKRIIRFEEHNLIYFGPRSGNNIINLIHLIHPQGNVQPK